MGKIWRAMPLLSTLAALVIIAHSAEEGYDDETRMERDYRYEIRPRVLDTGTPSYDQPWRGIEAEPMMQESTSEDHQPYEEPIKRKRPGRKRKRRPLPDSDDIPQEREVYQEETKYNQPEEPDTTDKPRRRRKRPHQARQSRWTEEFFDLERPLRRRNRRKRPVLESGPRFSEFDIPKDEHTKDEARDDVPSKVDHPDDSQEQKDHATADYEINNRYKEKVKSIPNHYFELSERQEETTAAYTKKPYSLPKEDRSLSEFSMEEPEEPKGENPENIDAVNKLRDKLREKSNLISHNDQTKEKAFSVIDYLEMVSETGDTTKKDVLLKDRPTAGNLEHKKAIEKIAQQIKTINPTATSKAITLEQKDNKRNIKKQSGSKKNFELVAEKNEYMEEELHTVKSGPIDPIALKEILKRSNGTSLSEILQEHNLSLADLLHGKEDAISVLQSEPLQPKLINTNKPTTDNNVTKQGTEIKDEKKTAISKSTIQTIKRHTESKENEIKKDLPIEATKSPDSEEHLEAKENGPRIATIRRYPGNTNIRRKLRLRPANGTMKSQLSRDLMAQTARKYLYYNSKNSTKGKEWKQVLPSMNVTQPNVELGYAENTEVPIEIETTTSLQEDKTTIHKEDEDDEYDDSNAPATTTEVNVETDTSDEPEPNELETENDEIAAVNTTAFTTTTTEIATTEKPKVRYQRPVPDEKKVGLRRQAFNNRLKRKRLKHKNSTTESPENDQIKDFLGLGGLVSSSEFISRTQKPETLMPKDNDDDFTSLDDFLTTTPSRRAENIKTTRISTMAHTTPRKPSTVQSTTEETAKIEIEEILNDTRTSARLSKILMERNMTLNELVEHRERGSSHVHLADIFHNASKEPNPPEPFLSKSSIEPISKETYPLRALLEANLHDPTVKTTVDQPSQYVHIPVVMDFGNNVNENGENMGIMSLFSKLTETDASVENSDVKKDSEGTPYITTIISVNASVSNTSDGVREGKDLKTLDVTGWNQLFELMRRHHENITGDDSNTLKTDDTVPEATKLDPVDSDGDGLIVLEDLHRLHALENIIIPKDMPPSEENLDISTKESDTTMQPGILDRLPSSTRSVTVATASIVGLAMVLFLLTYAAFKWKQQRNLLRKKQSFSEERIPTPVFESRKGHKNNCSTRSISPMLASNIYTMNTLDSRAGTESPEYMWDSLRKPFQ